MRIMNTSAQALSMQDLKITLAPQASTDVPTLAGLGSVELQAFINAGLITVVTLNSPGLTQLDSFVGTETANTLSTAQVTGLTGAADTTLHFHAADRARAVHTGTQLKATISDFTHGSASHTGAIGTLSQISDVTVSVANLNGLHPGAGTTAGRPVAPTIGFSYFDTTVGKPIWFKSPGYVFADGTAA